MPDGPGWYPDPYFKGWQRFWDGAQWTRQSRRETATSRPESKTANELVGVSTTAPRESDAPSAPAARGQSHLTITTPVPRRPTHQADSASEISDAPLVGQYRSQSRAGHRSSRNPRFRRPAYVIAGLIALILVGVILLVTVPSHPSQNSANGGGTTNGNGAGGASGSGGTNHGTSAANNGGSQVGIKGGVASNADAAIPTPTASQGGADPGQITPTTSPFSGSSQTLATGGQGKVEVDGQVIAHVKETAATVSSSPIGGASPSNGYFATFTVKIKDVSPSLTYNVSPQDFYVSTPTGQHFDVDSGQGASLLNATGALPSATLKPGQSVTGTVTIDEPSQHASLVYALSAAPMDSWSF